MYNLSSMYLVKLCVRRCVKIDDSGARRLRREQKGREVTELNGSGGSYLLDTHTINLLLQQN
jgi:hypothetical protein